MNVPCLKRCMLYYNIKSSYIYMQVIIYCFAKTFGYINETLCKLKAYQVK